MSKNNLLPVDGIYYAYLRKSRGDLDAEARGEGETLARHQKMLEQLAASFGIKIAKYYREIVSGETIKDRPMIQTLLHDISLGICHGVLVVEVERLARGDTSDQGTIASYFKLSNTLIITPLKIYNPNDEYDEEYFEFGLFMSRREYKTINRRIQRGRRRSAEEGKWIAGTAPFGYERIRIPKDKGFTLKIIPEQADIVRLVFDLYTQGELQQDGSYRRLGHQRIANRLDSLGIVPVSSTHWSPSTIKDMLRNPTYIGKTTFGKEQDKVIMENGIPKKIRVKNKDCELYEGLHPAIVSREQFNLVQSFAALKPLYPVVSNKVLKNPLSGLIVCSLCGSLLTRKASNTKAAYHILSCPRKGCPTVSAPLYLVEEKLLAGIKEWLADYRLSWTADKNMSKQLRVLKASLAALTKQQTALLLQKEKAFDLLEQGIYSPDIFSDRMLKLKDKLSNTNLEINRLQLTLAAAEKKEMTENVSLPAIEKLSEAYWLANDAAVKNELLRSILDHVEYTKIKPNQKFQRDYANFELKIFPKLPKS